MVGNAIMMFMKDAPLERPQTHDLFGHVLEALGAKVQRVIINDFKDEVYFGRLILKVENEIEKGKHAYVILPLIEDSEKINLSSAKKIFKYLSEKIFLKSKVGLLHGKLNSEEKNNIINSFLKNEINILVSTTVIEVGIDVPNASIMFIYNSERFNIDNYHLCITTQCQVYKIPIVEYKNVNQAKKFL